MPQQRTTERNFGNFSRMWFLQSWTMGRPALMRCRVPSAFRKIGSVLPFATVALTPFKAADEKEGHQIQNTPGIRGQNLVGPGASANGSGAECDGGTRRSGGVGCSQRTDCDAG